MDLMFIATCAVGLACVVYLIMLIVARFRKPKSKNPFDAACTIERPFVTDRKERKKVLKKVFKPDLVPENLDAIIIGSGIGGLACAGLLARSGKRVLVLEKHDRAGGATHTYKTKGFEYDIGIHYVGEMKHGEVYRCFMDLLTDNQLKWVPLKDEFDTVVIDEPGKEVRKYNYTKGTNNFKQRLLEYFPEEEKGINRFFELLKLCKANSSAFMLIKILSKSILKIGFALGFDKLFFKDYNYLSQTSLEEVLNDLTDNKDLKTVIAYCFGNNGALPSQTSIFIHGNLLNHFLSSGGYYPQGGASEIAFQIIPGIEKSGGAVLAGASVTEVVIENGRACGVRLHKTSNPGSEHLLSAPIVISDAGIYNTLESLVPKQICKKFGLRKGLDCVEPGVSCIQVMIGLNGTKEQLGLTNQNYWIFTSDDPGKVTEEYLAMSREDAANIDIPLLFLSFPSSKDPTWNERFPNKTTCVIVTLASFSWFEEWKDEKVNHRGQVYDNLKSCFVNQAWNQVLKLFPHLKDKVANIDGGTPLSHHHYLNSMHGEIYGIHHNKERFQLKQAMKFRPETAIPGLYLTGQDIFGCGLAGASFGGLVTASKILDRYLITDLIKHMEDVRKKE